MGTLTDSYVLSAWHEPVLVSPSEINLDLIDGTTAIDAWSELSPLPENPDIQTFLLACASLTRLPYFVAQASNAQSPVWAAVAEEIVKEPEHGPALIHEHFGELAQSGELLTRCESRTWFAKEGPAEMVGLATEVARCLEGLGLTTALSGSLALFCQIPFRLSPDIDFGVFGTRDLQNCGVVDALDAIGFEVHILKATYVGAQHRSGRYTLDLELDSSYRQTLQGSMRTGLVEVLPDVRALSLTDIALLKKEYGRFKDRVDIQTINRRSPA